MQVQGQTKHAPRRVKRHERNIADQAIEDDVKKNLRRFFKEELNAKDDGNSSRRKTVFSKCTRYLIRIQLATIEKGFCKLKFKTLAPI